MSGTGPGDIGPGDIGLGDTGGRRGPRRLQELVLDRTLFGLDDAEHAELGAFAARDVAIEQLGVELTGARTAVAMLGGRIEQPPADVRARLDSLAMRFLASAA